MTTLKNQFFDLWKRIGAKGDPEPVYKHLAKLYGEPHRHYHKLSHVAHCLRELRKHLGPKIATSELNIEFAIWFHDAIYETNPGAKNEIRSAELATKIMHIAELDEPFRFSVVSMILATAHNDNLVPPIYKNRLVIDIDLAIFAQSERVFDRYEENIRKEYSHVPELVYCRERAAILKRFLSANPLYETSLGFRDNYEEKAKANLKRSIDNLEARFAYLTDELHK